jgi:hypothetical protein
MMKALGTFAEAVVAQERQDPRGDALWPSDGHLGPHDAAGEQSTTDGPFVRTEGGDASCYPAWSRPPSRVQQSLW